MTLKKETYKLIKTEGNAAEVSTFGFYVQTVNHFPITSDQKR